MLAPAGKALVEPPRLGLAAAQRDLDSRGAQAVHSVTGDGGVGIDGGGDHAAQTRRNQRVGARTGAASVVTRLQGDVGCAAAQPLAGVLRGNLEGSHLGVVHEVVLVPPFAGYLAGAIQNHAAHGRVGRGDGDAAPGQLQGSLHPLAVEFGAKGHGRRNTPV